MQLTSWQAHHFFDDSRKKQSLDNLLQGKDAAQWLWSTGNKFRHLSKGISGREEKYRVRLTIGGDKLEYDQETAST
eukprot:10724617-Ditylum_brightwellii.AAC.1